MADAWTGQLTRDQMLGIQALFNMSKEDSSESEDENIRQRLSYTKIGSGSDCHPLPKDDKKKPTESKKEEKSKIPEKEDCSEYNQIWTPLEADLQAENFQADDPREEPRYDIKFKQAVGTEDTYLGINFKTPGTASCEWITVNVDLKSETIEKMQLSVESNIIDLRTPKYRLRLPTPFPVDPNSSTAKWHSDEERLEITLKLIRELDPINF